MGPGSSWRMCCVKETPPTLDACARNLHLVSRCRTARWWPPAAERDRAAPRCSAPLGECEDVEAACRRLRCRCCRNQHGEASVLWKVLVANRSLLGFDSADGGVVLPVLVMPSRRSSAPPERTVRLPLSFVAADATRTRTAAASFWYCCGRCRRQRCCSFRRPSLLQREQSVPRWLAATATSGRYRRRREMVPRENEDRRSQGGGGAAGDGAARGPSAPCWLACWSRCCLCSCGVKVWVNNCDSMALGMCRECSLQ